MKEFIDLNLASSTLKEKAVSLGFSKTFSSNIVESDDIELLRKATKTHCLIINPTRLPIKQDVSGLVRDAKQRNACFEIRFALFSHAAKANRAKLFAKTIRFLKKAVKLGANYAITSGAETDYDLKTPRELTAFGQTLGLTRQQTEYALSETPKKWLEERD